MEGMSINQVVAQIARRHAERAEDAGDFVGPNDMALANACYSVSARLKEYAKVREDRGNPEWQTYVGPGGTGVPFGG